MLALHAYNLETQTHTHTVHTCSVPSPPPPHQPKITTNSFCLFQNFSLIYTCHSKHSLNLSVLKLLYIYCIYSSSLLVKYFPQEAAVLDNRGMSMFQPQCIVPPSMAPHERPFTIGSPWGLSLGFFDFWKMMIKART